MRAYSGNIMSDMADETREYHHQLESEWERQCAAHYEDMEAMLLIAIQAKGWPIAMDTVKKLASPDDKEKLFSVAQLLDQYMEQVPEVEAFL
jgi:hypothetical protein